MGKKRLRSVFRTTVAAVICISLFFPAVPLWAASGDMEQNSAKTQDSVTPKTLGQYDSIPGLSGEILYDTAGQKVMANGGEIHQVTENGKTKWYWFGEDVGPSTPGQDSAVQGIHLYSSTDLYNWTREEDMFKGMASKTQFETDDYFRNLYGSLSQEDKDTVFECLSNCPTAHPRVLYNENRDQYVMWVPTIDGKQCIATSSSIKGPFKFEKYCESIGGGFTEVYKESDGTAYILYQNGSSLFLSKLKDNYMDVEGVAQTINFSDGTLSDRVDMLSSEVGMFRRNGKYYMVHAAEKKYAVADSLSGTWSVHTLQLYNDEGQSFEDIPNDLNLSPTHQILQVNTESGHIYINITESWITQSDMSTQSRYVWLPIRFSEDGAIALRKLSNWKLDVGDIEPEGPGEPGEPEEPGSYDSIPGLSGEILYDTAGQKVMANGGEIHQVTENGKTKWYWFGEDVDPSAPGQASAVQGIHLYSSTDLYNWTREEDMLQNCPTAHPRMLYNETNQEYVMWVPTFDGKQYIATSDSIKGPFKFEKYCESIGGGFTEVYKESDGTAYILHQSGTELFLSKLTDDYMDVAGVAQTINFSEGTLSDRIDMLSSEVGMFKRNGKYYMVHAGVKKYAVADSLDGIWSVHTLQLYNDEGQAFEDVPDSWSPTHQVLQVSTESGVIYINITENWITQSDMSSQSRYVWLPIRFSDDGTIALRKLSNWKLEDIGPEEIEEPPVVTQPVEVTEVRLTETSKTLKV
ncbi:MAG: family 43 glycosylhydrolase, partial [Lachnospiraceae bacterium]|nr:family 43 glycosylhydrolase [Lachnospiraceae bacterium]